MAIYYDLLEELATIIESQDTIKGMGFDMQAFNMVSNHEVWLRQREDTNDTEHPWCGTVGCIGGWAIVKWGRVNPSNSSSFGESNAVHILSDGTEDDEIKLHRLFNPNTEISDDWKWITNKVAAIAIREFIETNNVNWAALARAHKREEDYQDFALSK